MLFVIIIPILIFIISMIADLGILYIEKRNISNNIQDAIEYYLDNNDKKDCYDNTKKLLEDNIKDSNISIDINDDIITVVVIKKHKSLNILNSNEEINIKYIGYIKDKRIVKG